MVIELAMDRNPNRREHRQLILLVHLGVSMHYHGVSVARRPTHPAGRVQSRNPIKSPLVSSWDRPCRSQPLPIQRTSVPALVH